MSKISSYIDACATGCFIGATTMAIGGLCAICASTKITEETSPFIATTITVAGCISGCLSWMKIATNHTDSFDH